jgi:hypothetical protein
VLQADFCLHAKEPPVCMGALFCCWSPEEKPSEHADHVDFGDRDTAVLNPAWLMSELSAGCGIMSSMDFPVVDLFDNDLSAIWQLKYFHQDKLRCPHCGKGVEEARVFRTTKKSRLTVYRCACQGIYNLYSGIVFAGKHLRPAQAILLLRGVCKGEPTVTIADVVTPRNWTDTIVRIKSV